MLSSSSSFSALTIDWLLCINFFISSRKSISKNSTAHLIHIIIIMQRKAIIHCVSSLFEYLRLWSCVCVRVWVVMRFRAEFYQARTYYPGCVRIWHLLYAVNRWDFSIETIENDTQLKKHPIECGLWLHKRLSNYSWLTNEQIKKWTCVPLAAAVVVQNTRKRFWHVRTLNIQCTYLYNDNCFLNWNGKYNIHSIDNNVVGVWYSFKSIIHSFLEGERLLNSIHTNNFGKCVIEMPPKWSLSILTNIASEWNIAILQFLSKFSRPLHEIYWKINQICINRPINENRNKYGNR